MKIHKRSSNGRGEYELAGAVDGYSTTMLIEKQLVIDAGPELGKIPTNIALKKQGGKPRLRRLSNTGIHIQRQLEALLLMPKSIREESQLLGGQPVIIAERYILSSVEIKSVLVLDDQAIIKLGGIDCVNDSVTQEIDFSKRISQLMHLYQKVESLPPRVAQALRAHHANIQTGSVISSVTERLVLDVIRATEEAAKDSDAVLIPGEDPVPLLLDMLRSQPMVETPPLDEIDPADIEIRRRVADRWRLQKDRGPASTQFRRDVRRAYDSGCLFCGLKLPTSEGVRIAGVDAAHIIPWSQYEADVVVNGLCLCKLHHWAFDQYLLALRFDGVGYEVVITELAKTAFANSPVVMQSFEAVAGPIPLVRLPANKLEWPSPKLLGQLYEDVRVDF
ncbi:hypothetical protein BI292_04055 [Pseudomonas sp. 43NM1]|uniref:HNH endonuclease n=1 Tax=Pseudomonas sp. 43NM1 TaxID=1904755 RepID=UPI000C3455DD|nr:HNH endonuclease [Pseudomonas sp. 43NM1]PKH18696.1 hypothetical protein BI292_04055 [Pseudomonas sp. 43NM1]